MAAEGLLRCVFEGCISAFDMEIERRPYHRNCGCALHKSRRCTKGSSCNSKISYPVRCAWADGSLAVTASSSLSPPCSASPSLLSSSNTSYGGRRDQVVLCSYKEYGQCILGE